MAVGEVVVMAFASQTPEQYRARREQERADHMRALCKPTEGRGSYGGTTGDADPKSEPKRNRALLDMARDRRCLLQVEDVCTEDTATTIACHSNLQIHGKAGARKADDQYSVWGCMACHRWLDQSKASAYRKETTFMLAHLSQVLEWRRIAGAVGEPERFRKAAQWALDELGATPVGVTV